MREAIISGHTGLIYKSSRVQEVRIFFMMGCQRCTSLSVTLLLFLWVCITGPGCDVKPPVAGDLDTPVWEWISAPDILYLESSSAYPVVVSVTDPQGRTDLRTVELSIRREATGETVWVDTLRDDGLGGDILPRDGRFFSVFTESVAEGIAGTYMLFITAEDKSGHTATGQPRTMEAVDSEKNLAPGISEPVAPDTLSEDDLSEVVITLRVGDPQGLDDIDSVIVRIYPPYQPVWSHSLLLLDDGPPGDQIAGDGVFSLKTDVSGMFPGSGTYALHFRAIDSGGLSSAPLVRFIQVSRSNDPPVLSGLSAPESLSRSSGQPILLSVRATDPQGAADIRTVAFNTTRPDGVASSGNPFAMFDDGSSGDETAGDGVYSLTIAITAQNMTGAYRFDFYAEDLSGVRSAVLTHFINVVE